MVVYVTEQRIKIIKFIKYCVLILQKRLAWLKNTVYFYVIYVPHIM